MPAPRRIKFIIVGCVIAALAATAAGMVALAYERHRLTSDPLALTNAADVRAACTVLVERAVSRGGSHVEARSKLKQTMIKLRDHWDGVERPDEVLADVYELIAMRVTAPGAQNREETLAVLSETRPTADDAALWERYRQALAKHGIAAVDGAN